MTTDTRGSAEAVAEAAHAMLEINRYAKQDRNAKDHIYELKSEFLAWLFEHGYCTGWNIHTLVKPEKKLECYGCQGTGTASSYNHGGQWGHWDDDFDKDGLYSEEDEDELYDDNDGPACARCGGTGVYRTLPELRLEFVAFRFEVGGRRYTWHQPREIVSWDFSSAPKYEDAGDWDASDDKTPSTYETTTEVHVAMRLIRQVMSDRRCGGGYSVNCPIPDGVEAAAVNKFHRDSSGTTLSVRHVDPAARVISLGNVRGESITYRWRERSDCNGFRFVAVEGGAR